MFYRCDPRKNKQCRKTTCYIKGKNCCLTSNPKYSIDGSKPLMGCAGCVVTLKQLEAAEEMGYKITKVSEEGIIKEDDCEDTSQE